VAEHAFCPQLIWVSKQASRLTHETSHGLVLQLIVALSQAKSAAQVIVQLYVLGQVMPASSQLLAPLHTTLQARF
jgi:hypothetical protein